MDAPASHPMRPGFQKSGAPEYHSAWSFPYSGESRNSATAASSRSRRPGRSCRTAIARFASVKGSPMTLTRSATRTLSPTFHTELSKETRASTSPDSRSNSACFRPRKVRVVRSGCVR